MVNPHYKTPAKAYQVRNKEKIAEKDKVRHSKYYDENRKEILEKKKEYYKRKKAQNQNDMNFTNLETQFKHNTPLFV